MQTTPTPPVPPVVSGNAIFTAPASGATVNSLPLSVSMTLSAGATLKNTTVTMNGTDISSSFTLSGSTATALLTTGMYIGNNRLKATSGQNTSSLSFNYDPSSAPGGSLPPGGSSTTLSDVIPIQTRVTMTNAQNQPVWGIQIGNQAYPDPSTNTNGTGFQVLVLQRNNLALVANEDLEVTDDHSAGAFGQTVYSELPGGPCGEPGCLVIIQSLGTIGYTPCTTGGAQSQGCIIYQSNLESLGATGLLSSTLINDPNGIGYSLIANVVADQGLQTPSSYERITCNTSDGCIQQSSPGDVSSEAIQLGVAPNGLDGVLPNLANTASSGATNIPATAYTPALNVSNNGAIHGALILDNYNNYSFSPTDPQIHLQMGIAPDSTASNLKHIVMLAYPSASGYLFPNGELQNAAESAQLPAGAKGGLHLAVFDATTWQNVLNATYVIDPTLCGNVTQTTCTSPDGTTLYQLRNLTTDIQRFNSRRFIFFLGSIGSLDHTMADPLDPGAHPAFMQDVWDRVAQSVQDIGGTYSLFTSLSYSGFTGNYYDQYLPPFVPDDDYNLVGQWWMNDTGLPNPYAMETSIHINRETMANPTAGNMDASLEQGKDGYYRGSLSTTNAGFLSDADISLSSVPVQAPIAWPLTGPTDSNALKAAYSWLSQQLLQCVTGCTDIRAAYSNLNQAPSNWVTLLSTITIPADCAGLDSTQCPLGFGQSEFDTARTQLLTETEDVAVVREYQSNIVGTLQNEQANTSLLLQEASSEVLGNVNYVISTTSSGNWQTTLQQSFQIAGPLLSAAGATGFIPGGTLAPSLVNEGFAIANLEMNQGAKRTYDPNGRSLQEQAHEQIAVGKLAQTQAQQYADTLTTVGVDFKRIVSDWGRLQAVAVPIQTNQLVWAPESAGALLTAFNGAILRSFYTQLLPVGYEVTHYAYAEPGTPGTYQGVKFQPGSPNCSYYYYFPNISSNPDSYEFMPGAPIDGPGSTLADSLSFGNLFPTDVWWNFWVMQEKTADQTCPLEDTSQLPTLDFYNTTGLFRPLDPASPTNLGLYKPCFYTRNGFTVGLPVSPDTSFWEEYGVPMGQPYVRGMQDWHPDPNNY